MELIVLARSLQFLWRQERHCPRRERPTISLRIKSFCNTFYRPNRLSENVPRG